MLSAFERRQANEDNPLWRQNAAIIRQLYQDERKTLKEVKAIMENEKGFPVMPLPTWEVKLRELGIQKKLKAKDWSLIYQHIRPRLQDQGKKEFRKPTVVLIHGTKKPWDKCWKEIRRNRATIRGHHQGPPPPLPSFVTIRTPSPELLETIVQTQPPKDVHFLVRQLCQTTILSLQPLLEIGLSSLDQQTHTSMCPTPDSVYKLCLQGIPFTTLLEEAPGLMISPDPVIGSGESQLCDNRIIPSSGGTGNLAISECTDSLQSPSSSIYVGLLSEFMSEPSAGQQLGLKFDSHHYLLMIIYLLSNNLVWQTLSPYEVTMSDILQMTFSFISRELLSTLFRSQLLSIKAAWEHLLIGAQKLVNKEAFEFLINVGMQNEWLDLQNEGHGYLFSAAQMNCPQIFRALTDRGCRATSWPKSDHRSDSIIVDTIDNDNLDCAKLLIQHCDINHEFQVSNTHFEYTSTHFAMFITAFDDTRLDHVDCLKFLLEQGANVDYEIDTRQPRGGLLPWEVWRKDWPYSILDHVYYFHGELFGVLITYSKTKARFSRAMALWNLEQGVDALRQYLDLANPAETVNNSTSDTNIPEQKNHFLEILLAERFLLGARTPGLERTVLWNRVAGLSELDIHLMLLPKTDKLLRIMLYDIAHLATSDEGQHKQAGLQIMQWLLERGLRVTSDALLAAYLAIDGATAMQFLASFCDHIKTEGEEVLVRAVHKNDLSSAMLLLRLGVDPTGTSIMIAKYDWEMHLFEAAACKTSLAAMKDLIQRGMKPRIAIAGYRPSLALVRMFVSAHVDELFNKVQYIVDEHMMIYEPFWPSLPLLELCLLIQHDQLDTRGKIFEFLLQKGAGPKVGSPLAEWIRTGGGHQLVRQMLGAGADPNAYSFTTFDPDGPAWRTYGDRSRTPLQAAASKGDFTLICLLLEHGADVNAPARATSNQWTELGQTALGAICIWDPVRREERFRKDKIVQLLLDRGADVNAANLIGWTALMYAACLGDISTAFTLLKHGARLNAISKENDPQGRMTALDIAAGHGRLDMVKFLLNANALSSTAWSNGGDYGGAIEGARKNGFLVISQLIKRHSAERYRWNLPFETSIPTSVGPQHTRQSLSVRTKNATDLRLQSRSQLIASENTSTTTALDQTYGLSDTREENEFESSHFASEAEPKVTSIVEVTHVSWPSGVEESGNKGPLAEAGCSEPIDARTNKTADQAVHTEEAISGNEAWFHGPRGQSWVKEDQQSAAVLATSSLAEDVFMGFP